MMSEKISSLLRAGIRTRREIIAGVGVGIGVLAVGSKASAGNQSQSPTAKADSSDGQLRTSLHQEVDFKPSPRTIYTVLLDSKQFGEFTGLAAEIDPSPGGAFTMFGGMIVGRSVELIPNERIVQAWRPTHWPPGVYSIVRFELKPRGSGSILILDQTGFPEGAFSDLNSGWKARYWDPLTKYLAR